MNQQSASPLAPTPIDQATIARFLTLILDTTAVIYEGKFSHAASVINVIQGALRAGSGPDHGGSLHAALTQDTELTKAI
jgi:hypothetical protein